MNYRIREIKPTETNLLRDFAYEAIFQRDETNPLPRSVVDQPEISIYHKNFGKPADLCLVAEVEGKIVGAVWTRILADEVRGFGNVDKNTPEFAISLHKKYRNKGIGAALMKRMLNLLRQEGYKQTSLAVQKDNYAVRMYESVGFEILRELKEEYLMICELSRNN